MLRVSGQQYNFRLVAYHTLIFWMKAGGRKDGKLGKGKAENQISQKCAQDLLQMAPDLCYYGRIMIGGY